MSIKIRNATVGDKHNIVELIRDFAREWGDESPITPAFVEGHLASPVDFILVAEWDGQFAGLLGYSLRLDLWHAAPCCYIADVVVKEKFRGQGIGTELIKTVLEKAKSAGCAEVSLTVEQDNPRAQALYKRLGIDEVVVGLEKHFQ